MDFFFNKLNLNYLIEIFTKYENIEKIKIYYDLHEKVNNKLYYTNKEEININDDLVFKEYCYEFKEINKDELPYFENKKLFIKNMNINSLIDSLIISSILNYEIVLPYFNINECSKLNIINNSIYNKLLIIDNTIYFSNFIKIIKENKNYINILNFDYKNYFNNFLIDNLPKLILFIIIKNEHLIKKSNKIKDLFNLNLFNIKKIDKMISKLFIKTEYKIIIKKYYYLISLLYNVKDKVLLICYFSRRYNQLENDIYEYCINVYNNFIENDKILFEEIIKIKLLTNEYILKKMNNISIINNKFKNNEDIISIIDYQDGFILLCKFIYENKLIYSDELNDDLLNKIFDAKICEIRANKLIGLSSDGNYNFMNNNKFKNRYESCKQKYNQLNYLINLLDEKYNNK
jgi:hypothetical protein